MRRESVARASPPQGEARGPEPALFDFKGNQLRTVTIDGEPWFVAKDVFKILGYTPNRDNGSYQTQYRMLRSDEMRLGDPMLIGDRVPGKIISESALYKMALKSTLPTARAFQDWVTRDVLPVIRKTGSYVLGEEKLDPRAPGYIENLQKLLIEAYEAKLADAAILAEKSERPPRLVLQTASPRWGRRLAGHGHQAPGLLHPEPLADPVTSHFFSAILNRLRLRTDTPRALKGIP